MPIRILLADDHPVFRSGLKALLGKEADMEVVGETGSGSETILAAKKIPADVLILDLNLPDMPGSRVAEAVLREHPKISIVVLTMHEDEYYVQELFKIGARAFVLKKATGTDLLQAIRTVYRGGQYVDPSLTELMICSFVGRSSKSQKPGRLGLLTPREKEVCLLLAYGHTNGEIAGRLFISERTVETHRNNIMAKLGLNSRADLVRFAIDNAMMKM